MTDCDTRKGILIKCICSRDKVFLFFPSSILTCKKEPEEWGLLPITPNHATAVGSHQPLPTLRLEETPRVKNIPYGGRSTISTWKHYMPRHRRDHYHQGATLTGEMLALSFDSQAWSWLGSAKTFSSSSTASYLSDGCLLQGICDELALKILIAALIARIKQMDAEDNHLWVKIIIW